MLFHTYFIIRLLTLFREKIIARGVKLNDFLKKKLPM